MDLFTCPPHTYLPDFLLFSNRNSTAFSVENKPLLFLSFVVSPWVVFVFTFRQMQVVDCVLHDRKGIT